MSESGPLTSHGRGEQLPDVREQAAREGEVLAVAAAEHEEEQEGEEGIRVSLPAPPWPSISPPTAGARSREA